MKVFITYCSDGYTGSEVDRVLDSREKAQNYVIKERFLGNSAYEKMTAEQLRIEADKQIDEREIE